MPTMSFNATSSTRVLTVDQRLEETSFQESLIALSMSRNHIDMLQLPAAIWSGEDKSASEDEIEQLGHVIMPLDSLSAKSALQSPKRLCAHIKCNIHEAALIAVAKQESSTRLRPTTAAEDPPAGLEQPPAHSFVNYGIGNNNQECRSRITHSKSKIQGCQSKSAPSPDALSFPTGTIYRKLYHRFLARKILRHKPTLLNRRTRLNLLEDRENDDENEDGGWMSETCAEKAQRTLQACRIEMSHTAISWTQSQFIEASPLGRYRCYRPSFLRWSWTMAEDEDRKIKSFPNGEE